MKQSTLLMRMHLTPLRAYLFRFDVNSLDKSAEWLVQYWVRKRLKMLDLWHCLAASLSFYSESICFVCPFSMKRVVSCLLRYSFCFLASKLFSEA